MSEGVWFVGTKDIKSQISNKCCLETQTMCLTDLVELVSEVIYITPCNEETTKKAVYGKSVRTVYESRKRW